MSKIVDSVINHNKIVNLKSYKSKQQMLEYIKSVFLNGIEELAGKEVRQMCEEAGLNKMHKYLDPKLIPDLQEFVKNDAAEELYKWTAEVAKDDLHISHEFFVQELLMIRINFPFESVRSEKNIKYKNYPKKFKAVDYKPPLHVRIKNKILRKLKLDDEEKFSKELRNNDKYHKDLPRFARSHGAHIDTWYGHSFDGINYWWAIEGVNKGNSMCMYPSFFGADIQPDELSMYLRKGQQLPEPYRPEINQGDLLIFNPELLHSTQLNVSDETRLAITTRINPKPPKYDSRLYSHFENWVSSNDIENGEFKFKRYKAKDFPGKARKIKNFYKKQNINKKIELNNQEVEPGLIKVIAKEPLLENQPYYTTYGKRDILIIKRSDGIKAFSGMCSHLGVSLVDGAYANGKFYCPGHGLEFKEENLNSTCGKFKLKEFSVEVDKSELIIKV